MSTLSLNAIPWSRSRDLVLKCTLYILHARDFNLGQISNLGNEKWEQNHFVPHQKGNECEHKIRMKNMKK